VGSNVARAIGDGLNAELGAQLRQTQAEVRARVDALVSEQTARARSAVEAFTTQAQERVAAERARLDQAKSDLQTRVRALAGGMPIGSREPGAGSSTCRAPDGATAPPQGFAAVRVEEGTAPGSPLP
jgi:multidrug efflux pump subunit AcrA (membrane-fusion protein)